MKNFFKKTNVIKVFLLFSFFLLETQKVEAEENPWKNLAIQHNGRVKPFDTFAREILREVYGQETFNKRSAVDIILSWLIIPEHWEKNKIIFIESHSLKKSLDLNVALKRFSPEEIKNSRKFALQLAELQALRQNKGTLDDHFKNLESLETKLTLYEAIKSSWLLKVAPQPQQNKSLWLSPAEMKGDALKKFQQAIRAYIQWISKNSEESQNLQHAQDSKKILRESLEKFKKSAFKGGTKNWYQESKIKAEIFYNELKLFKWAALFYFLFLMASLLPLKKREWMALPLVALGFLSHSLGLFLRSYIMSRPPVSNMYETVLWVPWVALIAGFVFYLQKSKLIFRASVLLAFFCLFLIHVAPQVLDSSLQPLEAVLRSSFWLSTHVLIITMSYSFFFLAFVLGDMGLLYFIFNKQNKDHLVKKMFQPIYRSLQWGVILLAAGTILGAIWADYSWGRFWAWDPKESWALISLLSYLALLHGRLIGFIKSFFFSVASVLMFFLVLMAWYGVNFILGKGLHSYGFGSGGLEYVGAFFALHILLCMVATFQHSKISN